MDTKCTNSYFDTVFSEKSEINSTSEYTLAEYMPGIKRIVKTSARVRVLEKVISDNKVIVGGETIFNVLYVSENTGLLKNVIFKEPFDIRFDKDIGTSDASKYHICVKTSPVAASTKNTGLRLMTARGKFTVSCEVLAFSDAKFCLGDTETPKCGLETLKRETQRAKMEINEGIRCDISREIKIDDDAPEIEDIVCTDMDVCINSVSVSDGTVKVYGKANFKCLYEAKHDNDTEYISLEQEIPFESEVDVPCVESSWEATVSAFCDSVTVSTLNDDYGEQRIFDISASVILGVFAVANEKCTVITDMYSVNENIVPTREKNRIYSLIDKYSSQAQYKDKVRLDLRGITEIVSNNLELSFLNPEFSDGSTFLPAKGVLTVLGVKENGEAEAQSAAINIRIPIKNIPYEIFKNKVKWVCNTYMCAYDCLLSSGELEISLATDGSVIALCEDSVDMITGYEVSDTCGKDCVKSGFSLYYPQKGESVWNVAKNHGVSYEKIKSENAITGSDFEKETPVILR